MLCCFCKKPVINDSDLVPNDKLGVLFTDTLTLITETVREDSLRVDDMVTNVLGKIDEPIFGKSVASIYMQLLLPGNNISFGDNAVLDSAVLMLQYASGTNKYGDISKPMNLVVYEINETMYKDSVYFSNKTFSLEKEIGRKNNFVANLKDSVQVRNRKLPAHARIKLDSVWANDKILKSASLGENGNFLLSLKGIYVTVEENGPGNGMVYLDLAAVASSLTLYYKNSISDTSFSLVVNASSATVNNYKHNYSGSVAKNYMSNNKNIGDSLSFIQSMAGLKTKIIIPHLKNLGNISINKAQLVITSAKTNFDINNKDFYLPGRLTVNAVGEDGGNAFVNDQFVSDTYFGGNKETEDFLGNKITKYKFNLALNYQDIINNKTKDSGIYLLTFPSSRIADRIIVGGGSHSKYKMKLLLTYTKIN